MTADMQLAPIGDWVYFRHPNAGEPLVGRVVGGNSKKMVLVKTAEDPADFPGVKVAITDATGISLPKVAELIGDISKIQWAGVVVDDN